MSQFAGSVVIGGREITGGAGAVVFGEEGAGAEGRDGPAGAGIVAFVCAGGSIFVGISVGH